MQAPSSYLEGGAIGPSVRMLGVNLTANHKSETQVKEIIEKIKESIITFKSSPLASEFPAPEQCLDMFSVPLKFLGLHSDCYKPRHICGTLILFST